MAAYWVNLVGLEQIGGELNPIRTTQLDIGHRLANRPVPDRFPGEVAHAIAECLQRAREWSAAEGQGLAALISVLDWHFGTVTSADRT